MSSSLPIPPPFSTPHPPAPGARRIQREDTEAAGGEAPSCCAAELLNPSPSTREITHSFLFLVEVFYCLFSGAKQGPGWLRPSGGLCLGLGAAVPTEAESSRVLRGEEGLGAERPGSFLHSVLWMKRGQPKGGTGAVPAGGDPNIGGGCLCPTSCRLPLLSPSFYVP